jgi:hypothetical protein
VKAWMVSDRVTDELSVTFAETPGRAKSSSQLLADGSDYTNLRVRRAPEWDDCCGRIITDLDYLKHGWMVHCRSCEKPIGPNPTRYFANDAGDVYCSPWCKAKGELKRVVGR